MEADLDRVRRGSADSVNARLDHEMRDRIWHLKDASRDEVVRRLRALDREWDVERAVEATTATLGLVGVGLGVAVHEAFVLIPLVLLATLLEHAVQGWSPVSSAFRRLGYRTRREIDAERTAIKALRGDFVREMGPDEALRAAVR